MKITQNYVNDIAYKIVGGAIEVHKNLGPGLLESVYETCLMEELNDAGLNVRLQVYVPINYKNKDLGGTLKLDILVNDLIIVELKAVDIMIPLYKTQFLLNFPNLSASKCTKCLSGESKKEAN